MTVVLFGSGWNPLSAVVADFFFQRGELGLVVLPGRAPRTSIGGTVHFLGMLLTAAERGFHLCLSKSNIKRRGRCLSLAEYLNQHSDIQRIRMKGATHTLQAVIEKSGLTGSMTDDLWIVCCVFPQKIPTDLGVSIPMINIHPGVLPENRGPNPYFWALAEGHDTAGITFHSMTAEMDRGEILYRACFPIPRPCSERDLEAITATKLADSLPEFWIDRKKFWKNRKPQSGGTYYPMPTAGHRRIYQRPWVFSAPRT